MSNAMIDKKLILAIAVLLSGVPVLAQNVSSPVIIQVSDARLRTNTRFTAHLKNNLEVPISFCVDFGKTVQTESGQQAAPSPFEVQKWNGKRWDTQLIGTDIGSGNTAISIEAHESKDFSLEINASGRYRLRLTYLEGESDTKCPFQAERAKTVRSKLLIVQAPARK